jgi:hypothetical protein
MPSSEKRAAFAELMECLAVSKTARNQEYLVSGSFLPVVAAIEKIVRHYEKSHSRRLRTEARPVGTEIPGKGEHGA